MLLSWQVREYIPKCSASKRYRKPVKMSKPFDSLAALVRTELDRDIVMICDKSKKRTPILSGFRALVSTITVADEKQAFTCHYV